MEEHEKFMEKIKARFEAVLQRLTKANAAIDMNVLLMQGITERTENFREYFFSRKMIDDAQRELSEKAMSDVNTFQGNMIEMTSDSLDGVMDAMFSSMEATIAKMEELVVVAEREVARLDK